MKKITQVLVFLLVVGLGLYVSSVKASSVFPSTNAQNITNGWAHIDQVSNGVGVVTLNLVSTRPFYSCFEYRTDGDTTQKIGNTNPNTEITDGLYPYYCQINNSRQVTFHANSYVELRLSFGAEKDERFDWTRFEVLPNPDLDGDGVLNGDDQCPNTPATEQWLNSWGTNRWQVTNGIWVQNPSNGKKPVITYPISATLGCNGHQILDIYNGITGNEMLGHYKFGLSSSMLQDAILDAQDGVIEGAQVQ